MSDHDRSILVSGGRRIAYAEWGDAAGTPVVYCHGFPGSRLEARLADAPARALGIRLIAPDRPGFGLSSLAPARRLADWPRDLLALADHLALARFHLIGVSGGAPYAIASGQKLGDRVAAIALVCGLGEFVGDDSTSGMNAAAATAINFHRRWPQAGDWAYMRLIGPLLGRYPTLVSRILIGTGNVADREVLADNGVRDTIVASFTEAFREGPAGPVHELGLFTRHWDIDPTKVPQPVQLWHGEADRTVPVAMGRRHASLLPDVAAHFLPGEGHFSLVFRYMRQILADLIRDG
ncbi:MAG: alpha/beta fold hydrolase [Sedimenticolaceae bacterium]